MAKKSTLEFVFTSLGLLLLGLFVRPVLADGTEALGPPGIPIAAGTEVLVAGTGLQNNAGTAGSGTGVISLTVPPSASVEQVLLYWSGEAEEPAGPDDTIVVNGIPVTGTNIGGPTYFFGSFNGTAFRADITGLGLVSSGANNLVLDGLLFPAPPFDVGNGNHGAGLLVVVDSGGPTSDIVLKDGIDWAFCGFSEPRKSLVPQNYSFSSAGVERSAHLSLFFGSVGNNVPVRPNFIELTFDVGGTTTLVDVLDSSDGNLWDTLVVPVVIPAGATSLTVRPGSGTADGGCPQNPLSASLTWIAGALDVPPVDQPASLGDRVWEDLDSDGVQDCTDSNMNGIPGDAGDIGPECDAGIPMIPVNLLDGDCSTPLGQMVMTDANGFYLFENLPPGDYCVNFGLPPEDFCDTNGFDLGSPVFTAKNAGSEDAQDSDADPMSGTSDPTNLSAGETDRTIDAGIYCPAKIGNLVFFDDNDNGLQDPGEDGVPDVKTTLFECGPDMIAGTADDIMTEEMRFTDEFGMYMYGAEDDFDLPPGKYYVKFDPATFPLDFDFTTPNVGPDDLDSDCLPPNGLTACTDLTASRSINLDRDCGLTPPPPPVCELALDKTCRVEPPPPSTGLFQCDKPIDRLTMIWNGAVDVRVNAWKGSIGSTLLADMAFVGVGDELAVGGYAGSPNDVIWEIFDASTSAKIGDSTFHLSCSDANMNGPEDCGLPEGDGKDKSGFLNMWLLEGMVDDKNTLDCTADPVDPVFPMGQACSATAPGTPDCDSEGKPTSLVFKYTGGGCSASDNDQSGDKAVCTANGVAVGDVTVVFAGGNTNPTKDPYTVDPTLVSPGGTFEVARGGDDFKSNSYIQISDGVVTELNQLHTSCSQPLAVGDTFGSLTVVGYNGKAGGVSVTYGYSVTNNGDPLSGVNIDDVPLGAIAGPFDLASGQTRQFTVTTSITGTTLNTVTASGVTADGSQCGASDQVLVTLTEPPQSCADGDPTALVFTYTGDACSATTNAQEGKFNCSPDVALGALSSVVMTKDASKFGVTLDGNTVTIERTDKPGDAFPSEIEYDITDADGTKQSHVLHTSCSKALNVGDQFGAFRLKEHVPKF